MKKVGKILLVLIILTLIAAIVFVVGNFAVSKVKKEHNPVVTMEIDGYGTIKIELYPEYAPNTVKNFIRLAQRGFYDGKTFNDIDDGLVRAGLFATTDEESGKTTVEGPKLSDIQDNVQNDYNYTIKGEFVQNDFDNNVLSHSRGVVAMYRSLYSEFQQQFYMLQMMGYGEMTTSLTNALYDSQASEFFITTKDMTGLNGSYSAFGKVIEGMDVIDKISQTELKTEHHDEGDEEEEGEHDHKTTKPVNAPVIKKVEVNTYGVNYGMPEIQERVDIESIFDSIYQTYMSQSVSYQ